ncbi:eIF-2-alpha kinase GCN2 isoform X3 [Olea europaea subsp. europaea]|uniref:eIF-2-alpha kinase GCN2 isoform X3 n=1 Tax=Olea europaea subsp. europaea TaxID=158383 RepID=A0A8S0ST29_OLEEU|nr:eIF-2-alpha kinase GCN2 isoform X3 [Olea europaea subsp. europaea]
MSHPNIVRYYQSWIEPLMSGCTNDLWESDEIESPCLYIAMEYCPGCLGSFLDDFSNHYNREQALMIFRQIVQALAHIHENNIIHRDLSRSNIFLDKDGNVKVGDFGLAKELDDDGHALSSTSDGTNRAPEYAYGEVDAKADIYSLGMILVELLYPFATAFERTKVLGDLKTGVYPTEWEVQHKRVIGRLISESPLARPTAAEILMDGNFVG